ncbi:uncharacterized protein LAESUDRAFT_727609 [Laetiporus sulphureus 93-53]|uniref:Uncharacterized protein n=1 Tax=Laetiporus sulphureus 93-53 TaxID=1314785 RepID=A0A165DEW3_9APHY|nr:uncharacterized protein LAESUDRAFT_727609 [Laetiporus sulphureus 93-53]KZT04736.1 hypothetical protein LAESUDRAFT_727609 [Laetiporus sulphureus 93-53]
MNRRTSQWLDTYAPGKYTFLIWYTGLGCTLYSASPKGLLPMGRILILDKSERKPEDTSYVTLLPSYEQNMSQTLWRPFHSGGEASPELKTNHSISTDNITSSKFVDKR